jgi:hypothetical protein
VAASGFLAFAIFAALLIWGTFAIRAFASFCTAIAGFFAASGLFAAFLTGTTKSNSSSYGDSDGS